MADRGAGELASGIAQVVPSLPLECARDLRRLLARSLTTPSPSELREARLGLLIDLVAESQGTVPGVADYEQARRQREEEGETWPSHTTLIRAYQGHWLGAVKAAMRVAEERLPRHVSESGHHHTYHNRYTREDVVGAVADCWRDLGLDVDGPGPYFNEYREWVKLSRTQARLTGQPDPRRPAREAVLKACGTWERALAGARRVLKGPSQRA
jgi:hypothetical protein